MMDAKWPDMICLWFKQSSIAFVLHFDFLDVAFWGAPYWALHIQHAEEACALQEGKVAQYKDVQ